MPERSWLSLLWSSLHKIGIGVVSLALTVMAMTYQGGKWFVSEPFRWLGVLPRQNNRRR